MHKRLGQIAVIFLSVRTDDDHAGYAAAAAAMEVLYDSQCMVCLTNKKLLTWFDRGREKVSFVDIRSKTYNGDEHGGVSFDDAMLHFHTVLEGKVAEGSEAVFSASAGGVATSGGAGGMGPGLGTPMIFVAPIAAITCL